MTRPSQRPLCPLRWHGSPVSAPAGHPGPAAVFPCRAGPAPITSLSIVGLCASGGSGYRAGGGLQAPCQAGGREGGRGPARACMKGERLGNPGGSFLLPLPRVLKVPPRKLLVPDIQLSEEKGPGGSFDAAALGSRAPAHPGRTPAACSDTSPRPRGPLRVTNHRPAVSHARAGLLRLLHLKPRARNSPPCQSQALPQAFASEWGSRGDASRATLLSPSRLCGRRAANGSVVWVLGRKLRSPRDAGAGSGVVVTALKGHSPWSPWHSGLTPLPAHAPHRVCSSRSPSPAWPLCLLPSCETSWCPGARRLQAPGSSGNEGDTQAPRC